MYRVTRLRNGNYRGYLYESHEYHTGLKRINNTTGRWVSKVIGDYEFVKGWLRNLVSDEVADDYKRSVQKCPKK